MQTTYAVRALPVRAAGGDIVGWVRVSVFADGSDPRELVFLRDGSALAQEEALELLASGCDILYNTREDAVAAGIARLRAAERLSRSR
jgi:hypothetical protein